MTDKPTLKDSVLVDYIDLLDMSKTRWPAADEDIMKQFAVSKPTERKVKFIKNSAPSRNYTRISS